MKNVVIVLLVIAVFFACAGIGYLIADFVPGNSLLEPTPSDQGDQHKLIVVHVDGLDSSSPRLVSIWFLSLFFHDGLPPTITFAQIYPSSDAGTARSLERSFSLNREGDPQPGFWQSIRALDIQWEGYLVLDQMTINRILGWIIGPGDYNWVDPSIRENPEDVKRLLIQACESMGGIDRRETLPFSWGDLVPVHFHSNLPMEKALVYWERVTKAEEPVKCDVLLSP